MMLWMMMTMMVLWLGVGVVRAQISTSIIKTLLVDYSFTTDEAPYARSLKDDLVIDPVSAGEPTVLMDVDGDRRQMQLTVPSAGFSTPNGLSGKLRIRLGADEVRHER
jgi:hypothetical protein